MAFLDVTASGALPLLMPGNVVAVATSYAVVITHPEVATYPATALDVVLLVSCTAGTNSDVEVQVDDTADFSSPVYDVVLTNLPNGNATTVVSGLVAGTTYYIRARPAATGTTNWAAWSPTRTVTINVNVGKALQYVMMNVGPALVNYQGGIKYVDENVGPEDTRQSRAIKYVDENVGFNPIMSSSAVHFVTEGDVNTDTPSPVIWFLRPDAGRAGDAIGIYGFGFGDLQTTFNSVVEWLNAQNQWVGANITSWQTFPPDANAYTDKRLLDPDNGIVDMQHQVIQILIDAGALPPGFAVRVKTNGA